MVASVASFNPYVTTTGQGLFDGASANGGVQGCAMPDPAVRFQLRTTILSINETLPMWGGIAIYENIPARGNSLTQPRPELGPTSGRATTVTGGATPIAGFSVFDHAYGMITTPQSTVPTIGSYGQVMSYRLGSGARIWLAMDPSLVSLIGSPISSQVTWDFVNQMLIPYTGTVAASSGTYDGALTISSGTYNTTTGLVTLTLSAASHLSPGNTFTVTGATGTGSFASINGTYTAGTGTSGTTVTYTIATGLTMTITGGTLNSGLVVLTLASSPNLSPGDSVTVSGTTGTGAYANANGTYTTVAGTGGNLVVYQIAGGQTMTITGANTTTGSAPLPCNILDFNVGNSMVVTFNAAANTASWNYSGSSALVQI